MVRHIPCGTFVNESERFAVERLQIRLRDASGTWILLSNLNHAQHPSARSDEIDIVAIGGPGVFVIEVKHWDAAYVRQNGLVAEREADRIDAKAKRVAGKLRQRIDPGFVDARLLLTRGEVKFDAAKRPSPRAVRVFGLPEWSELLSVGGTERLSSEQIDLAARLLEPSVTVALHGELRTFAGLINLERLSAKADAFHRIYRGQHPTRRDRVILHLYDLSACAEKQALELARREFETIQRWQKSPFVPSLLDSFQEAEGYPGELYFYSLVDPDAPTIADRSRDTSWDLLARHTYAIAAIDALCQFHQPDDPELGLVHRRLSPRSLRVRHNNQPLFTDFNLTRLRDAETVSRSQVDLGDILPYVAEEVRQGGLAAADARSDIAALCASLQILFDGSEPLAEQIRGILEAGRAPNPADRPSLEDLAARLRDLSQEMSPETPGAAEDPNAPLPPAEYWDEDTVVPFHESRYKILSRLGGGGIGQTFKVVELDAHCDEKFGTYVAKLVRDRENGEAAIHSYRQVRAYTTHPNLSTIHEIAASWEENRFVALMRWLEGLPLQDLIGVLALHAEDLGEASSETLVRRWLSDICAALGELHRVGLVHGDVSPRNMIVQGLSVVLTDYDFATQAGKAPRGGTLPYASPEVQDRTSIQPADDVYALAASLFHVLADREPFMFDTERRKDRGLNWEGIEDFGTLRGFFDRATHPDAAQRFSDALAAHQFLAELAPERQGKPELAPTIAAPTLTPNHVPWLRHLLSSYPGSRHGNSETRGLDSPFAEATYVETHLDDILLDDIQSGRVNLIVLFGNAGDGKTAFLQHLAQRLDLHDIHSSRRVWESRLRDGKQLKVNLDGAAAWEGTDANALLDDLFRPFHNPNFSHGRIHIVAVNNGKLLEWIETQPEDTWLTEPLRRVLLGEEVSMEPRFRLIDLNRRSLVGGIDPAQHRLTAVFLDTLIDRLLGGDTDHWKPCSTCAAQGRCTAWDSVQALRDPDSGRRLRQRITDLLQACHQRGEIHITARELRAALSYCLFGVHDCAELHKDLDLRPPSYWQRAFDADSAQRQGELLAEMARFDPALEADPILDRLLLRERTVDRAGDGLAQARRRAWLTRTTEGTGQDIALANGRHLARFRDLPLMPRQDADALLRDLCLGIARLEDLPALAFATDQLDRGLPLRITPRTPTESAFWVVKPWKRFDLKPALPLAADGLETLHTHVQLIYRYANGGQELLSLGLELFHLLLELKDGVQLSGVAQEGAFTNLEIFTQRLAHEDARALYGWHPTEEERIFRVQVVARDGRQILARSEA